MQLFVFSSAPWGRPIVASVLHAARAQPGVQVVWVRLRTGQPRWRQVARDTVDAAWIRTFGVRHRLLRIANLDDDALAAHLLPGANGLIAGFSKIFSAEQIARFATLINLHPSLLPYYRGPVPSLWALHEGESWSGFTAHRVTPRIDVGEILFQGIVPVQAGDTSAALDARIATAAAAWVPQWVHHLATTTPWTPTRVDADEWVRTRVGYRSFPNVSTDTP